jgi:hypothetical protein
MPHQTPLPSDSATAELDRQKFSILFAAAALLLIVSVIVRAVSHDEGQYVSAIALMRHGLPYRDFPYLQTPLQPLLLSPLALLPAGWLLVAARTANALFALATLAVLAAALKPLARPGNVAIALGALACCDAFLLAGSLARNDALPMMLQAAAILAVFRAIERNRLFEFAIGGVLLGLAISAKINAALPAAGASLFLLLRVREHGIRAVLAFALGILLGLAPSLAMGAAAPGQFRFGVFEYSLDAPRQWWASVGKARLLDPGYRIVRLIGLSALGPSLVALSTVVIGQRRTQYQLLLDLMIVGGIIGSYMPEPAFPQYLVPMLVPLFTRLALSLETLTGLRRRVLLGLTGVFCAAGLIPSVAYIARTVAHGADLARAVGQGREVASLARGGDVVTLSPERIAGSDVTLDPRFATGPFLFRTFGPLSDDALHYGLSPNWQRAAATLDAAPPAVIMVGGESEKRPPMHPQGLEHSLVAWAIAHGYRAIPLPSGFRAFQRPSG